MPVLGFLGPCGTHSEEAAAYINKICEQKWQLKPYRSIFDVINAAAKKDIDSCFVPIENSIEGSVRITLDTLALCTDLQIRMELVWKVHNQLLVKNGTNKITKIISHPQPLAQCRKYINKNYHDAEIIEVSSTAYAAKLVADGLENAAAIASKKSGELYGLATVDTDIQDNCDNATRFILLNTKDKNIIFGRPMKMMLICQMDGTKAGSLCSVLMEFAKYNINMTRIESRPSKNGLGNYIFFFEIEVTQDNQSEIYAALDSVNKKCFWLKNVGMFPVLKANEIKQQ